MGNNRALSFTFTTEDQQAIASLKRIEKGFKGLDVQVDRTSRTGTNFGNTMAGLAVGAGLAFSVSEFEEAEKGMRATEAVIRSTGNAAEVSAEQQAKLVDELSRLAGIDDDVVNGGANMLRTFTEIKGENFGLALAASLDIAAMKGQDFATVSEQVGKALNDPVAGMGKLAKQGVVLSEVQKQQVRDFAAVGDTASAQKVILDELEREYGGQAEAAATSSGRMKVAFGEAAESVGAVLAPAMEVGADAVGGLAGAFGALPGGTQAAVIGLGLAGVAAKKAEGFIGDLDGGLGGLGKSLTNVDKGLIAASAGLAAFSATTAALESVSDFKGDVEELNAELGLLGEGKGTVSDLAVSLGTDLDGLAGKFRQAADAPKDWKDAIGDVFSKGTEVADVRQAQETIEELDQALAGMVESGNAEGAKQVFDALVETLADQGLAYDEIIPLLNDYDGALDRAERGTKGTADATSVATGATEGWYGATLDQRDALLEQAEAQREANDETQASIDLANEAAGASLSESEAHDRVQDAQLALAEARKTGDPEKIQRAQDDLARAMIGESVAAQKAAAAALELQGKQLSAGDAAAIQKARLEKLRTETGYTSTEIDGLVWSLSEASKGYTVALDTAEAEASARRLKGLLDQIKSLSTETGIGGSILSGTAGAAIQQSEAYNEAQAAAGKSNARTSNARSGGVTVNVGTMVVGGSRRDLDRAMNRAAKNTAHAIQTAAA